MDDLHITRELLWAVSRGELPASVITQVGTQHLMSLCRTCRREITRFEKERRAATAADPSRAFELLPGVLEERIPRIEQDQQEAARDLENLLALPPDERIQRVERARKRFRSAMLVRLLIEESRKRVQKDPEEAFHLASLARLVAHRNPRMPRSFDLISLATAHIANACRASGDLREAEEHFGHARYVIAHHEVADTEVLARVDKLEGSLRMDQRQFQRAEELLVRAAMLYRVSGDKVETARALITLGVMHFYRGDVAPAIEATKAALAGFRAGDDPRLYVCGRFNLARYLTEDGQYRAVRAGAAGVGRGGQGRRRGLRLGRRTTRPSRGVSPAPWNQPGGTLTVRHLLLVPVSLRKQSHSLPPSQGQPATRRTDHHVLDPQDRPSFRHRASAMESGSSGGQER